MCKLCEGTNLDDLMGKSALGGLSAEAVKNGVKLQALASNVTTICVFAVFIVGQLVMALTEGIAEAYRIAVFLVLCLGIRYLSVCLSHKLLEIGGAMAIRFSEDKVAMLLKNLGPHVENGKEKVN